MTETMWTMLGWTGTVIFLASFTVKSRSLLHLTGLIGSIVKAVYTVHYGLWPLAANWVILIGIEAWQWWKYRAEPKSL